jgi:hypothetical protein
LIRVVELISMQDSTPVAVRMLGDQSWSMSELSTDRGVKAQMETAVRRIQVEGLKS